MSEVVAAGSVSKVRVVGKGGLQRRRSTGQGCGGVGGLGAWRLAAASVQGKIERQSHGKAVRWRGVEARIVVSRGR